MIERDRGIVVAFLMRDLGKRLERASATARRVAQSLEADLVAGVNPSCGEIVSLRKRLRQFAGEARSRMLEIDSQLEALSGQEEPG